MGTKIKLARQSDLPSQSGQAGKVLVTDGSVFSWGSPSAALPLNYMGGFRAFYKDSDKIQMSPYFRCKSNSWQAGTPVDISIPDWTDVAISGHGLINGNAYYTGTGTVTANAGTNTVTGSGTSFTTTFVVGDVISMTSPSYEGKRITAVNSNTSLTVESNWAVTHTGVAYAWGGEAGNTNYYLYAITKEDGTGAGYYFCTRSGGHFLYQTIPSSAFPSGYTNAKYRQLPFAVHNDSGWNILYFKQHGNKVLFSNSGLVAPYQLFNGTAAEWTTVSAASIIPVGISQRLLYNIFISNTINNQVYTRVSGGGGYTNFHQQTITTAIHFKAGGQGCVDLDNSATFEVLAANGCAIWALGYEIAYPTH